jgi:drug/metabolite transporter (DMT)-like permease
MSNRKATAANLGPLARQYPEFALLMVPLLWGWGYPLIRESMETTSPVVFLFWRFMIALVPLSFLYFKSIIRSRRQIWKPGIITGIFLFLAYLFLNWGLTYTTTSKAGFIIGFRVIIVPIAGLLLYGYHVQRLVWIAAALAVAGLGFIFFGEGIALNQVNPGDGIMLLSAAAFAMHILLISKYSAHVNPDMFMFVQIATVTVCSGAGMLFSAPAAFPAESIVWKHLLITGIFSTALAYFIQNRMQYYTTANKTSIVFLSESLFAAFFGFLYLAEMLHGWQWAGAILILGALFLAQKRSINRRSSISGHDG